MFILAQAERFADSRFIGRPASQNPAQSIRCQSGRSADKSRTVSSTVLFAFFIQPVAPETCPRDVNTSTPL